MSMLLRTAAAGLLFLAAPAFADSPFDGTWKGDLSTAQSTEPPSRYSIMNGTYRCQTCQPTPYAIPADGAYHRVAGRPYWDELSVTVVDDHNVTFSFKKDGQVVSTNTNTISADGRAMTMVSHNTNNGGGVPIDATGSATRVGAPVVGAHLMSGSWQVKPATSVSDQALTVTMRVTGNSFHQETGLGESLDATIGGPFALNQRDPGHTMTKVQRLGPRTLRFTDMNAGRVTGVTTWTVAADGQTISSVARDPKTGGTFRATLRKQ